MGGLSDGVHTASLPRLKAGWEEFLQGQREGVLLLSVVLTLAELGPPGSYWKYKSSLAEEKHKESLLTMTSWHPQRANSARTLIFFVPYPPLGVLFV